ncbi:GNAT family N-acetyltransferase [Methanolobus sp.]|uniref:GNAT family N-acetyltransferase n=1 Tax=Methanolobus sp. TaxID=1874737 RepID=UPI0025D411FC|nr:GNAT family N-acetyltransferase [Methanolobus sp.]
MQVLTIDDSSIWDNFIDKSPYGAIFHKWGFLKIIEKHTGYTLLPYGMCVKDRLVCVFPVFLKTNYGVNVILSPPPRTGVPYMGFVMSKEYDTLTQNGKEIRMREIVQGITGKLDEFSPIYVSIQVIPSFIDIREFKWNDYSIELLFTYYLPTEASLEGILKGFSRSTRNVIKKIIENKFNIEMRKSNDVLPFYEILSKRYEEQGIRFPIISIEYLEDLLRLYPQNINLYYVYDEEDNIIGSSLAVIYNGKVISWLGTPKPDVDLPVNDLIFWELIKISKDRNCVFEIGGADTRRLCSFKSRFNPSIETNYRVFKRRNIGALAEWVYLNVYKRK